MKNTPENVRLLRDVLRKEAPALLRRPGVRDVRVGLKEENGALTQSLCVQVLVKQKLPADQISPKDMLRISGYPVDVIELGTLVRAGDSDELSNPWKRDGRSALLQGGINIQKEGAIEQGSLGMFVYDALDDLSGPCILTCAHVIADRATKNGYRDIYVTQGSSEAEDRIAEVVRSVYLTSGEPGIAGTEVDAALARVIDCDRELRSGFLDVDGFEPIILEPSLGMKVVKSGAETGVTTGIISSIEGDVIHYQLEATTGPAADMLAGLGDLGAVLLGKAADGKLRPVGLIVDRLTFELGDGSRRSWGIATRLSAVANKLQIRLEPRPGLIHRYWHEHRKSTTYALHGSPSPQDLGYQYAAPAFQSLPPGDADTASVYCYSQGSLGGNFFTTDTMSGSTGNLGYALGGSLSNLNTEPREGLSRLGRYFNPTLRDYALGGDDEARSLASAGYRRDTGPGPQVRAVAMTSGASSSSSRRNVFQDVWVKPKPHSGETNAAIQPTKTVEMSIRLLYPPAAWRAILLDVFVTVVQPESRLESFKLPATVRIERVVINYLFSIALVQFVPISERYAELKVSARVPSIEVGKELPGYRGSKVQSFSYCFGVEFQDTRFTALFRPVFDKQISTLGGVLTLGVDGTVLFKMKDDGSPSKYVGYVIKRPPAYGPETGEAEVSDIDEALLAAYGDVYDTYGRAMADGLSLPAKIKKAKVLNGKVKVRWMKEYESIGRSNKLPKRIPLPSIATIENWIGARTEKAFFRDDASYCALLITMWDRLTEHARLRRELAKGIRDPMVRRYLLGDPAETRAGTDAVPIIEPALKLAFEFVFGWLNVSDNGSAARANDLKSAAEAIYELMKTLSRSGPAYFYSYLRTRASIEDGLDVVRIAAVVVTLLRGGARSLGGLLRSRWASYRLKLAATRAGIEESALLSAVERAKALEMMDNYVKVTASSLSDLQGEHRIILELWENARRGPKGDFVLYTTAQKKFWQLLAKSDEAKRILSNAGCVSGPGNTWTLNAPLAETIGQGLGEPLSPKKREMTFQHKIRQSVAPELATDPKNLRLEAFVFHHPLDTMPDYQFFRLFIDGAL